MSNRLSLVFLHGGTAVLEEDGEIVWASDDDEEFQEVHDDVLDENDKQSVLEYLIEEDILTEEEAQSASIEVEENGEAQGADEIIDAEFAEIDIPKPH